MHKAEIQPISDFNPEKHESKQRIKQASPSIRVDLSFKKKSAEEDFFDHYHMVDGIYTQDSVHSQILNTDKNSQITSSPVKSDSLSIDPKEKKQKLPLVKPLELNHIPVEDKTAESKMLLNPYENNQFDL